MTGPEHYAEAERQLALADQKGVQGSPWIARAQVHALLALADSEERLLNMEARILSLEYRVRVLEEADETDGLADRIAEIERRGTT